MPKQTYDIDGLFQAKPIFIGMRELKAKSEALMKKLEGAGTVAPDRAELAKLGKAHYAGFNYLDSTRFLEAATA